MNHFNILELTEGIRNLIMNSLKNTKYIISTGTKVENVKDIEISGLYKTGKTGYKLILGITIENEEEAKKSAEYKSFVENYIARDRRFRHRYFDKPEKSESTVKRIANESKKPAHKGTINDLKQMNRYFGNW